MAPKIELSNDLNVTQEHTKTLLSKRFPGLTVVKFGSFMKVRSDFRWGLSVNKNLFNCVGIPMVQEKTLGGKDKANPQVQLVKRSPLGGVFTAFTNDSLLREVDRYLRNEFQEEVLKET